MATVTINICGDFTSQGRGAGAIANHTALSSDVLNLFSSSDLNIVNLEEPVATDISQKIEKSGPALYTSAESVTYLKRCGVQLVTLANNHFFDYGRHGVEKTLESLKREQIDFVGGGLSKDEISKIHYFTKHNIGIAILNYCEHEFSVTDDCGSNGLNAIRIYKDIQTAKQNADFVIIICHGGHEGYSLPSPRMKELYHFFIDSGANVVCNHHQHCFSGYEEYQKGTIFYGLGNFFFDDFRPARRRNEIWNSGYIVQLKLNKNTFSYAIIPYYQCLKENISVQLMTSSEQETFWSSIEKKNLIIANDFALEESFNEWCKAQSNDIMTVLSPYSNKYLMALCRRKLLPRFITKKKCLQLLNTARCEAHRDVMMNVLNYFYGRK